MPLHADNERVPRQFDGFDHAVGRFGGDLGGLADLAYRLAVERIDSARARFQELGQARFVHDFDLVRVETIQTDSVGFGQLVVVVQSREAFRLATR